MKHNTPQTTRQLNREPFIFELSFNNGALKDKQKKLADKRLINLYSHHYSMCVAVFDSSNQIKCMNQGEY